MIMLAKLLRNKKKQIVGVKIDDKPFFFSMNDYPLGPEAYSSNALAIYNAWLEASVDEVAQYGRELNYIDGVIDEEMEELDPGSGLLHRAGHIMDAIDGEFEHEELMRKILEREDIYENGIEGVELMLDVLGRKKGYFKRKISQGNFSKKVVENLQECMALTDQIMVNYRFAKEIGEDTIDLHGRLYSRIEEHLD